jgi:GNAT superfamily N-acetyltransferase
MAPIQEELTIREFEPGDEAAFRRLNEEWIRRYFAMESKDEETLSDPRGAVLAGGGRIFFAVRQGETVGCCALIATGPGEFEVAKMAVTPSSQGAGIGRLLLEAVIAAARVSGAARLTLETNRKLSPAIRLYESVGFRHVPDAQKAASPYARSDVSMEMDLE